MDFQEMTQEAAFNTGTGPNQTSVIVPAYNAARTLEACLTSILDSSSNNIEIIVVDDGSNDQTGRPAAALANRVVTHEQCRGTALARFSGLKESHSDIVVFVDSDVLVGRNDIDSLIAYMNAHPEITAASGRFAEETPEAGFFSQYKNLYMHYIFSKCGDSVTFIFGSIFAARRQPLLEYYQNGPFLLRTGEDTALGQYLYSKGLRIAFRPDIQVTHLKRYSFLSFLVNDFCIPFSWAQIYWAFQGWRQFERNSRSFSHSPLEQLLGVTLAPLIIILLLAGSMIQTMLFIGAAGLLAWLLCNWSFFRYLWEKRGSVFFFRSIALTFLDHIIMATGIASGSLLVFFHPLKS